MKRAAFLSIALALASVPVHAEWRSVEELNKAWDKMVKPGEIQKSGDVKPPTGPWQQPGDIKYVTGEKAITEKREDCNQRFTVGSDCLFQFGKSELTKDAEETLKVLGPKLKRLHTHPITIEGHTDSIDTDEKNQVLSEKRAERVKNWLMQNHFVPLAVSTKGFGEKTPVAPNTKTNGKDNPEGRALNRRVVIVVDTCTALPPELAVIPGENTGSATESAGNTSPGTSGNSADGDKPNKEGKTSLAAVDLNELLPYSNLYSTDEIGGKFKRFKIAAPAADQSLAYEILVPFDWDEKTVEVSKEMASQDKTEQIPIGVLVPRESGNAKMEIRYTRAGEDAVLSNILRNYAEVANLEIVGRRPAEFNGRQVEDALLKSSGPESVTLTRFTASKANGVVFLVACTCPEGDYEKWKRIFGAAAVSFTPNGK